MADGSWKKDLEDAIARCVSIKRDYVDEDEFDNGARQFLNLGHTFGHAVEKSTGYTLSHGQCVAIGMVMAFRAAGVPEDELFAGAGKLRPAHGLALRPRRTLRGGHA